MPEQLGPYLLDKRIGAGGMADVFLARGPRGVCVVKRPHPHLCANPEFVRMFLDEASILAHLHHPGIAQIYDLGQVGSVYYLAMEYVPGFDLMTISLEHERHGELMLPELCARIVADAASALHFAHEARGKDGRPLNIIHRDVTPHNILLSTQGQVKVIDFGVARASSATHRTQAGFVKGKYPYMAPEQITGQAIDHRVDVYALGLVLYELLTNVRAIAGQTEVEQIDNARSGRIRPIEQLRPNTPVPLRQIVGSCLLVEPDARYPSALALREDLERYIAHDRRHVGREDLLRLFRVVAADVHQDEPPTTQPVPGPGDDVWLSGRPTELESAAPDGDGGALEDHEHGLATTTPSMAKLAQAEPVRLDQVAAVLSLDDGPSTAPTPGPATEAIVASPASRMPLFAALAVAAVVVLGTAALLLLEPSARARAGEDAGAPPGLVVAPAKPSPALVRASEDGGGAQAAAPVTPAAPLRPGAEVSPGVGAKLARLRISSVPTADVTIGKRSWQRTPTVAELPPGTHTVVLVNRRERFRYTKVVRLGPGEASALDVTARKGTLKINVTPFAAIRLNGDPLLDPPGLSYTEVELYEGSYVVDFELSDPSLPAPRKKRVTAVVRAGEVTRLDEHL